jgi:hypothetical protein
MRSHLFSLSGSAALALILLAISPADAITITAPAEVRRASAALDMTEAVHCRDYVHRHKHGHARGLGCDVETDVIAPRSPVTRGSGGAYNPAPLVVEPLRPVGRPPGNYVNPSNPQDRSGNLNPQDMTQPRAFNPQDMR